MSAPIVACTCSPRSACVPGTGSPSYHYLQFRWEAVMKSWQKYAHVVCIVFSVLALSTLARAQQPFSPRVPIKIPAGTLGVQPNLALVYAPNAGNGLVGMGWSLAGLSEITRVNYGNGINFDAHDTFAHSDVGVLVRQADQPDSSGVNQPTYRSKKESFMRFQQY